MLSSLPPHKNNYFNPHRCCVRCLIALRGLFLLIANCNHLPEVVPNMEYSRQQGHFRHQQRCLDTADHPCHWKWDSNFAQKSNMIIQNVYTPTLFSDRIRVGENDRTPSYYSSSLQKKYSSCPSFVKWTYLLAPYNSTPHKICMRKSVNINCTTISLYRIFDLQYKH